MILLLAAAVAALIAEDPKGKQTRDLKHLTKALESKLRYHAEELISKDKP